MQVMKSYIRSFVNDSHHAHERLAEVPASNIKVSIKK